MTAAPDNPFTPGSTSYLLAALMLDDHAAGRWRSTPELMRVSGASRALAKKVRERLQADGRIGHKGDYSAARSTLRRRERAVAALGALVLLCVALGALEARAQSPELHAGPHTPEQSVWYTDALPGPCDGALDELITVERGALVVRCEGTDPHRMVYYATGAARVVRQGAVTLERREQLRLPLIVVGGG